jgi:hypothetical protein
MDNDIESVEDIMARWIRNLKRACAMATTELLEEQLSILIRVDTSVCPSRSQRRVRCS